MNPKKIKVLYIEDNSSNRNLVRYILEPEVFEYFEAEDALSGIDRAKEILPDIILMDINMMGMSGTEATIKIKQMPDLAKVPVIAVTAKTMKGDREKILAAGCSGYIAKPIDVDTFQSRVLEIYRGSEENLQPEESIKFLKQNQTELVLHLESEILKLRESRQALSEKVMELERKNIELKETQEKLIHSEKLAAAGELVAGIIHEIRTPLTGIMGYHQLLKMKIKDSVQLEYLEHCIQAVDKIKNIVSDMLNYAKKDIPVVSNVNLVTVLGNLQGLLHILSKQETVPIQVEPPTRDLFIHANSGQIEQVIMALVNNAIYAVKKLSEDRISHDSSAIIISTGALSDEETVFIRVADKGIGMTPEVRQRILEPFYTTKPMGEGTGLGLSICRTIVEAFHGVIDVQSEVGLGTTITIQFPRVRVESGAAGSTPD